MLVLVVLQMCFNVVCVGLWHMYCRSRSWTIVCSNPSQISQCTYKLASFRPISKAHPAAVVLCLSTWSHGCFPCKEHPSKACVMFARVYY